MAFELRELQGSLFDNDRKERDNQPDMTGSCKIDGVEYWVSAWIKQGRSEFLSLAFTAKDNNGSSHTSPVKKKSFLSGKSEGKANARKAATEKYEREKAEYEKLTGQQIIDNEFDDDIPF